MEDLQGLLSDMMMEDNERIGKSGFSLNSSRRPRKRTRIL